MILKPHPPPRTTLRLRFVPAGPRAIRSGVFAGDWDGPAAIRWLLSAGLGVEEPRADRRVWLAPAAAFLPGAHSPRPVYPVAAAGRSIFLRTAGPNAATFWAAAGESVPWFWRRL